MQVLQAKLAQGRPLYDNSRIGWRASCGPVGDVNLSDGLSCDGFRGRRDAVAAGAFSLEIAALASCVRREGRPGRRL